MEIFAIESPVFQPAMRIVTAITNANPAAVTTSFDHDYITGDIVRLNIPKEYGMQQADQMFSEVIVTSPTTFTMNINTLAFTPFVDVSATSHQRAQVVPIGEINSMLRLAVKNVLPTGVR